MKKARVENPIASPVQIAHGRRAGKGPTTIPNNSTPSLAPTTSNTAANVANDNGATPAPNTARHSGVGIGVNRQLQLLGTGAGAGSGASAAHPATARNRLSAANTTNHGTGDSAQFKGSDSAAGGGAGNSNALGTSVLGKRRPTAQSTLNAVSSHPSTSSLGSNSTTTTSSTEGPPVSPSKQSQHSTRFSVHGSTTISTSSTISPSKAGASLRPPPEVLETFQYLEYLSSAIGAKDSDLKPPPDSLLVSSATVDATAPGGAAAPGTGGNSPLSGKGGSPGKGSPGKEPSTPTPMTAANPKSSVPPTQVDRPPVLVAVPLSLQLLAGTGNSPRILNKEAPSASPASATDGRGAPGGAAFNSPRPQGAGIQAMVLLRNIHMHAVKFLKWVTVAESSETPLGDLANAERCLQVHSGELISAVVGFAKQLKTWKDPAVLDFMRKPYSKSVLDECARQTATVNTATLASIAVKRIVQARDLARAKALLQEFGPTSGSIPPPPPATPSPSTPMNVRHRVSNVGTPSFSRKLATPGRSESTSTEGGAGQSPRPPAPAAIVWLARSWLPPMEVWTKQLEKVHAALHSGDPATMQDTLTRCRAEIVTRSAELVEILLPNETLTELTEKHIAGPLQRGMVVAEQLKDCVAALKSALLSGDFQALASAVRSTEGIPDLPDYVKELVADAQCLLINMQKVAKVTVQLSIAQKSTDIAALVRAITTANQLIYALKIAPDMKQCKAAADLGVRLLNQPIVNAGNAFAAVQPDQLIVEHLPNVAWAVELSGLYQSVAKRMVQHHEHNAAKSHVAMQLPELRYRLKRGATSTSLGSTTFGASTLRGTLSGSTFLSGTFTSTSFNATDDGFNPQHAQLLLERCEAAGVAGAEVEELRSLIKASTERQLKIHFNGETKLLSLPKEDAYDFGKLLSHLQPMCRFSNPESEGHMVVHYVDVEGDRILVDRQSDWDLFWRNRATGVVGAQPENRVEGNLGESRLKPEVFVSWAAGKRMEEPPRSVAAIEKSKTSVSPPPPNTTSASDAPPSPSAMEGSGHYTSDGNKRPTSFYSAFGSRAPATRPVGSWIPQNDTPTQSSSSPVEPFGEQAPNSGVSTPPPAGIPAPIPIPPEERQRRRSELQHQLAELKKIHTELAEKRRTDTNSSEGAKPARPPSQGLGAAAAATEAAVASKQASATSSSARPSLSPTPEKAPPAKRPTAPLVPVPIPRPGGAPRGSK